MHANRMRSLVFILIALSAMAFGQSADANSELAARYFQEAKWASDDDGGQLWGKPLYGPILFINPESRDVYANQADGEGRLTPLESGRVWVGKLPKEVVVANTATQWAGVYWTMVMWPLPDEPGNRTQL